MPANKPHILLIDDEESMCRLLTIVLVDRGYTLGAYTHPQEALAAFSAEHYDLVLTDFEMPTMNGMEVLERVKQVNPKTPVILITGYPLEQIANQALDQGAYDILSKPFDIKKLFSIIQDALRHVMPTEKKQDN